MYSPNLGSKEATAFFSYISYNRIDPSVEQVKKRRLLNGEIEMPVTGPKCGSKLEHY
jgi:hypothetical protein